jgi:hypothetical protein
LRERTKLIIAVVTVLVIIIVAALFTNLHPPPPPTSTESTKVPVGAFLYLWYGNSTTQTGGLGSPGWNSSSCPGGGSVVDKPNSGYYVSDSNQTFGTQIQEMQSTGISFAVVSWWGPFSTGEAGAINHATLDLFRFLKGTNSSLKAAIMVDAFTTACNLPNVPFSRIYDYVQRTFSSPYARWYFDWEGKPLLLFFNPLQPTINDNFTVRTVGNRPNPVNWTFWDAPPQYFRSQAGSVSASNDEGPPVISPDGEVTLVPRIDSYFDRGYQNGSYLRFDSSISEGLYQEQWDYVLSYTSNVKLVLIYSWNEYHERSSIEPHLDYTAQVNSTYLLDLTSYYIEKLG